MDERFSQGRFFLKSNWHLVTETQSDQQRGLPPPLQENPPVQGEDVFPLPGPQNVFLKGTGGTEGGAAATLHSLLSNRKSRRSFSDRPVSLDTLSYLLWACEGVRENRGKFSFRTVPSGGARHPLDLYIFAYNVESLGRGLYRYLPLEHALVLERGGDESGALDEALMGQFWQSPCIVMWAAVPYRSEWRYGRAADKLVALDAGHSCQNLYLACEALGLGTCAVGAYDQEKLDAFLGLDGQDMFAMYVAPVGYPVKRASGARE